MKIKLIALLLAFISLLFINNTANAASTTKHIVVGDTNLVIEAPKGMCFVDKSSPSTALIHQRMLGRLSDDKHKQIIAIFTPCSILPSLSYDKIVSNFGYISWIHPALEYPYNKTRNEFILDTIKKYNKSGRKGLTKLDNGVATLIRSSTKVDYKIVDKITLMAYTTVRNIPLEIKIKDSLKNFVSTEQAYNMLNNFINYQIKINE